MEIVKRHLFIIILGVITLAATGYLLMRYTALQAATLDASGKLDNTLKSIEGMIKTSYALNQRNVEAMKANADLTDQQVQELYKTLRQKFAPPVFNDQLTPIQCKLEIDRQCDIMRQKLGLARIPLAGTLHWFGFDTWREPNIFPKDEEILLIRKHLEIVKELVDIALRTRVAGIEKLDRVNQDMNLLPIEGKDLSYSQYNVVITGNVGQVQQFLENLNASRYLLIVSQMNINAADEFGAALSVKPSTEEAPATPAPAVPGMPGFPPGGGRPGAMMPGAPMGPGGMPMMPPGAGPGAGLPAPVATPAAPPKRLTREERIVLPRLVSLRLELVLDYIEFTAAN